MKQGMKAARQEALKAAMLSLLIGALLLGIWHLATLQPKAAAAPVAALTAEQIEYARLMGKDPASLAANAATGTSGKSGFPTPAQMGVAIARNLASPFYDNGPNDKGVGLQLAYSLGRVGLGYLLAAIVAIPLGFVIGMSPLIHRALDPYIQVLKPISPLAWMPLALYTIKDSAISGIFVIFICSIWPMLINTAFGVAGVRKEWLNVARTLEVRPLRKAFEVILPAAAPTILTGMRISMGIAWLVIVAAEMLVGGTGIGYFVWNEWNNLSLPNVIFAVLVIGIVGMLLDLMFARLQQAVTYAD
jgi:nitrate/nitrite transport system permease protein